MLGCWNSRVGSAACKGRSVQKLCSVTGCKSGPVG